MAEDVFEMVHPGKRVATSTNNWSQPEQGWIELNFNGAKCRLKESAAKGLLRDTFGLWLAVPTKVGARFNYNSKIKNN
jgi:hypothetical protein